MNLLLRWHLSVEMGTIRMSEVFSAVVGNPPYQITIGDNHGFVSAYHKFAEVGQSVGSLLSMIYPSRWQIVGFKEGMADFREREITSPCYVRFIDRSDTFFFFDYVDILGGINTYLWDRYKTVSQVDYNFNGMESMRETLCNNFRVQIRDPRFASIIWEKIAPIKTISHRVSMRRHYGITIANEQKILKAVAETSEGDNTVRIFYISQGSGVTSAEISSNFTVKSTDDYKVLVSRTANPVLGGHIMRPNRIFHLGPGEIASDSFLKVGSFRTEQEAISAVQYLKTDFCNFLISVMTPTQTSNYTSYGLVPDVSFLTGTIADRKDDFLDFTDPGSLDDQLAKIYGLTSDDRVLMTTGLRRWKDKVDADADM